VIIMPVSLPTAADVRKARVQAAKNAAERAETARTPLLAVLGVGDLAVTAVTKAAAVARNRATAQAEDVQHRVAGLPQHLNSDEVRKAVADLRVQAEETYAGFAERGEKAWGRIRKQPQVRHALATIETYTEKLDGRVDDLVVDARDAAEKALATVSTQTRFTGERVARVTQRFTGQAAEAVSEASKDTSKAVADAGADAAGTISDAGGEVAHDTRSASRKAANRTAPKTAPKAATPKPAARRTSTANGNKSSS
jgi:heparin binding hemagglutinin HbhA